MATLVERERLETLERPVDEKKKRRRGLWLGAAAVVIAIAAGVAGSLVLGGGEEGFEVDFDTPSNYVPNGAAELTGALEAPESLLPVRVSTYVPPFDEPSRMPRPQPNPGVVVDFNATSTYVPSGADELPMALDEGAADSLRYR